MESIRVRLLQPTYTLIALSINIHSILHVYQIDYTHHIHTTTTKQVLYIRATQLIVPTESTSDSYFYHSFAPPFYTPPPSLRSKRKSKI